MSDSYNAEEEYLKFAREQYDEFRKALVGAMEVAGDKPVLLIIARPSGGNICNWAFNVAASDQNERYTEAAAYSFLAAAKAAEDVVDKNKTILSLQIDPDLKRYARKTISTDPVSLRRELQPFSCDISGFMNLQDFRISHSDRAIRSTNDMQKISTAEIKDINNMGSLKGHREPKVVIHLADSERLALLHGHTYENLRENGGDLRRVDAKSPFGETYGAVLSYNLDLHCAGFGFDRGALVYASNMLNAKQLEPPGELPAGFTIEGVAKIVDVACDEHRYAQDPKEFVPALPVLDGTTSPPSAKL